jgi:hypothetical protein
MPMHMGGYPVVVHQITLNQGGNKKLKLPTLLPPHPSGKGLGCPIALDQTMS